MQMLTNLKRNVEAVFGLRGDLPSHDYVRKWSSATKYSPDVWNLQRYENVWLFVYGNEMLRHDMNTELLDIYEPECGGMTFENFTMWKHNLGKESYPIVLEKHLDCEKHHWFKTKYDMPFAKIKGELYKVPPRVLFGIDNYRENGVKFVRKRTQIIMAYRHSLYPHAVRLKDVKAWMYVGVPDEWHGVINDGVQHHRFQPVRSFKKERPEGEEPVHKAQRFIYDNAPDFMKKEYYYWTFSEYK